MVWLCSCNFACMCVITSCPQQTSMMLAEQILSHPDVELPIFTHRLWRCSKSKCKGASGSGRRGKHRTLRLQNCFLWEMGAEFQKISHTFGSEPAESCQQETGWQDREGLSCALGRPGGLHKFCVTIVSLGWTMVLQVCF